MVFIFVCPVPLRLFQPPLACATSSTPDGTLTLRGLTPQDAGIYECNVDNGVGHAVATTHLTVLEPQVRHRGGTGTGSEGESGTGRPSWYVFDSAVDVIAGIIRIT